MRILLTNPCGTTGQLVEENLRSQGFEVFTLTAPNARKMTAYFLREVARMVEEVQPDLVIPIFFPEVLAANKDLYPGTRIATESYEKIHTLDNKILACDYIESLGIPQPRRYTTIESVGNFPVVFKRPEGQGGDSVYFPGNPKALLNLTKTAGEFLLTDFIEGHNYCVDALRWDDHFQSVIYKVISPIGKGVSREREIVTDFPVLGEYAQRILDGIDYNGVCEIDFRVNDKGEAFFLECNPRFSGGLQTSLEAGFQQPYELVRRYLEV